MLGGACVVAPGGINGCSQGGMRWPGGCVWQRGDMRGKGGPCMAKGACVVKWNVHGGRGDMHGEEGGVYWHAAPPPHEIRPFNARAVRILLECSFLFLLLLRPTTVVARR